MENKKSISNKKYYEKNYEKIFEHLKQKRLCEVCNRECQLHAFPRNQAAVPSRVGCETELSWGRRGNVQMCVCWVKRGICMVWV